MTQYPVPAKTVRIETTVVNSRFIATAGRAETAEGARQFIRSIREELPDATHHVYAFKIGYGGSVVEGMSDDGEPTGTSGPPILAVLRGANIGDIVVVVTRYFGGTKLGTGGLVRAYSGAAKAILASLPVELKIDRAYIGVTVPYSFYERLRQLMAEHHADIDSEEFDVETTIYATLPLNEVDALNSAVQNLTSGQCAIVRLDGKSIG